MTAGWAAGVLDPKGLLQLELCAASKPLESGFRAAVKGAGKAPGTIPWPLAKRREIA